MSNRSYLYTYHPSGKPRFRDFAEWRTDPPLAHLLLVGAKAAPCRSAIWKTRRKIAIRGDAVQARPVFLAFLDWLEPQLPKGFARAADEARPMLLRADRQGTGFHLELGEIYELGGLELDEMETQTFAYAAQAEALFAEVWRLVVTEGSTLRDSIDERIKGLADGWEDRLGLFFSGILYFHLGGGLSPKVRLVKVPPIPPPSRATGRGTAGGSAKLKRESSPPSRKGEASPPADSSLADWQRTIVRGRRALGLMHDVPASDRVGWLYLAISDGRLDEARRLITSGVDVNAPHELGDGGSCLEWAAEKGSLELVKLLVEHGADVNFVGKNGPALLCAVTSGHVAVYDDLKRLTARRYQAMAARRVAEATRSPGERDRVRRFSEACGRGLIPTIRRLIGQGIDVNARCAAFQGLTPLALASRGRSLPLAAKGGYTEIVELLLASGADPNLESYEGQTPLMWLGDAEIGRRLLAAGADAQAVDDEGRNVLMRLTSAECCRLLLEAGAKVEAVDRSGRGVLWHVAWWSRRRQELGWLKSVIDARYDSNLAEIFHLLIAAGAQLDPPAADGQTALSLLAELQAPEAKRALSAAPVRSTKKRNARR